MAAVSFARYEIKRAPFRESAVVRDARGRFADEPGGGLLSPKTIAAVQQARETVPRTGRDWGMQRVVQRPPQRRIDRDVQAQRLLAEQARQHLEDMTAWLDGDPLPAEFAEQHRQDAIGRRGEVIGRLEAKAKEAELELARLEQMADDPDLDPDKQIMLLGGYSDRRDVDVNGQTVPPPAYEEHLDKILDIGEAIQGDLRSALKTNATYRTQKRRLLVGDLSPEAIDDLDSSEKGAALAERAKTLRDLATVEAATLHKLLGEIRAMGGVHHPQLSALKTAREDWQERLDEADEFFPTDWLRLSAGQPLAVRAQARAQYAETPGKGGGTLAMPRKAMDQAVYSGAFRDYTQQIVVHELGHRMETVVPGLRELQWTYLRRRTTHRGVVEPLQRMPDAEPGLGFGDDEVTYRDTWSDPYAGKTYESTAEVGDSLYGNEQAPWRQPWEIFQVGIEDTFGRSTRYDRSGDLRSFVLGVLATLGHPD